MNPLTNVKNIQKLNDKVLQMGVEDNVSWHKQYKDSAYIFIGGLPYDLSEGDILCVFSQYGEVIDINLVREKSSGKSKGYGFLCYEDQRSTILAVDNFNGIKLGGRTIRVDHVASYRRPKGDEVDESGERKELPLVGCAPKTPSSSENEEWNEEEASVKEGKNKKKKKEKTKKRSKDRNRNEENMKKVKSNKRESSPIIHGKTKVKKLKKDKEDRDDMKSRGNEKNLLGEVPGKMDEMNRLDRDMKRRHDRDKRREGDKERNLGKIEKTMRENSRREHVKDKDCTFKEMDSQRDWKRNRVRERQRDGGSDRDIERQREREGDRGKGGERVKERERGR